LSIAVYRDDFPVENGIDRQRGESALHIRESAGEVPFVSRPECDTGLRPNSDGSIAVKVYLVLPSWTFGQFICGQAKHRLNETGASALSLIASLAHLSFISHIAPAAR
jgi:hypothetical protein